MNIVKSIFLEGDVLILLGFALVFLSSESLSDSLTLIIDLETVPRNPRLSADQNVICPFYIFFAIKVLYALTSVLKMNLRNSAVEK